MASPGADAINNPSNWHLADNINRALSAANASLYALTAAVVCSMGFIPQLGFVHEAGTLPFIYDAADLYKHETSWAAAFEAISVEPRDDGTVARRILKRNVEQTHMLQRMPEELKALFAGLDVGDALPATIAARAATPQTPAQESEPEDDDDGAGGQ